jgi:hypothetical protein
LLRGNFAPRNMSWHCIAVAPPPASAASRLGAFPSERDCSPRFGEESNPVLFKPKRKNMNTTETINATPQPKNQIVKPFKFPPQPQEWKIVSLKECPTPESMQTCETPAQAADYWRTHIATHPHFNPECECLVVLILNTRRKIKGHYFVSVGTMDTILVHPREVFRLAVMASASAIILSPSSRPRRSNGR